MKLGTEYLGMSKLLKHAIKSYLKNLTWCGTPWNFLQHIGRFTFGAPKHCLLPSIDFIIHYTPPCWPGLFFCHWYYFWKMSFNKSWHIFVCGLMALKFPDLSLWCSVSSACISSTLNLKWSILVCPEFAWHITIQFRTVILSNLLNSFMYHLVIFFLSKK